MVDTDLESVGWGELAAATPGGVAVQSGDRFVYASETLASMVGVAPETLRGEHWRTLFDRTAADRFERGALATVRADGAWEGTVRVGGQTDGRRSLDLRLSLAESGSVVWMAEEPPTGARTGVPGDSLERILDALGEVVFVLDERDRLRYWNATLAETTGYSHEEIDGMHPVELIPEDHHGRLPAMIEAIEAGDDRLVEIDIVTADGERLPHEVGGATVEDPSSGDQLRCGVARAIAARNRCERIVETVDDGVYALDSGLRFTYVNDALCEMLDRPRSALLGTPATAFLGAAETATADRIRQRAVDGDTDTGTVQGTVDTTDGERTLEAHYRLYPEGEGEYRGSIGVVRDVTEREARKRQLQRQRDEFATLDRINELLLETIQALVQTTSRDAIERTVTRRLTDSDRYAFAWVGEPELDGSRIVPRARGGPEQGYLAEITPPENDGISGDGPAGRAVETGEVQVANVGDQVFEPWRDRAAAHGFESVIAVPLQHGETVYGVLVVYATREDAFTPRERSWFDTLGRTVGFAIHAAKNRALLFADSAVELEFDVSGSDTMLVEAAEKLGCGLTLDGYVAAGEHWVLYVDVEGADPREVLEAVSGIDRLERSRVLGESGRLELTVTRSKLLDTVTAAGASLRRVEIGPDSARLLLDAPVTVDVRELVSCLQAAFPETALLSRQESDHDPLRSGRPANFLGDLTTRQREALEAAFHAGYFDWPRETTAEAVAESLDIAPPTLHGHLRKAERTLLSAILED